MTDSSPSPLPGYGLAPPTSHDALAFLARAVGPDQAAGIWMRACADARVSHADLSLDEMMRVTERLSGEEGVVGVIGTSLHVRVRTYRLLARSQGRSGEAG